MILMHFSDLPEDLAGIYSSKEEYGGKLDEYDRFLYQFSKNKEVLKPIVSTYLIRHKLLDVEWPENRKFAVCLTHDIDTIAPSLKYSLYSAAKFASRLQFKESWQRMALKLKKNKSGNPFYNFREISSIERKYGAKSSFYFKTTSSDPIDWVYDIKDLSEEIANLADLKFEVGLHGGFYSYNNADELRKEKQALESVLGHQVNGIRMHCLRFAIPNTWRLLANIGFKYDTTFGYSDMPGFRNGMCHPYKPYDLSSQEEINFLEIPLTIMDASLFKMPFEKAWATIESLIDATEENKGVLTILWHNNTFDKVIYGKWASLYERILAVLKDKNAWMTSGEEIYEHWTRL